MEMKKESNVLMWVLLILLPPIGIIYMWLTKKTFSTKKKGILTVVFVIWFAFCMTVGGDNNTEATSALESAESNKEEAKDSSAPPIAKNTEEIVKTEEITSEAATKTTESKEVPAMSEDDFKSSCQAFNYKTIARNPDDYIGQNFVADVKIFQTANGRWYSDYDVYYKAYTNDEYDLWLGDFLYIIDCQDKSSDSYLKVLDDDIVRVYGTFNGMTESKNSLSGTTNDEVSLDMYYCELISE